MVPKSLSSEMEYSKCIVNLDEQHTIAFVDDKFCAFIGYTRDELKRLKINLEDLIYGENKEDFFSLLRDFKEEEFVVETKLKRKDGNFVNMMCLIKVRDDIDCKVAEIVNIDITAFKASEKKLNKIIDNLKLQTDKLTGLYNRNFFKKMLQKRIKAYTGEEKYAVFYIDINNFSYFNEYFNYNVGNKILCDFANILKVIENIEFACRMYSDFFIAFCTADTEREILEIAAKIHRNLKKLPKNNYNSSEITISIGIYFIKDKHCSVVNAMEFANLARKNTKINSGKYYEIYSDDMTEQRNIEQNIAHELKEAMNKGQIRLFLQPKFLLETKEVVGAEALVRWEEIDGILKYPDEFIPVLEKLGHIIELDFYIYEKMLQVMKRWKEQGKKLLPVSVNFSRKHSSYEIFVKRLCELAEKYGVDKNLIEIELTEGLLSENLEQMINVLKRVKKCGFTIDLDDFGTGYSSLNVLLRLPIDIVKIDKSFLDEFENSEEKQEYIRQLGTLIKSINKEIIVEGVETEIQAKILKEFGFEVAQGYLVDKPISVKEFEKKYIHQI